MPIGLGLDVATIAYMKVSGYKGNYASDESSKNKQVSVIVPVYNEEKHISQTLEDLASQSHHIKNIIVMDDGSSDKTYDLVAGMRQKYSNIFYVKSEKMKSGKAMNINTLLEKYSEYLGDFTYIIDSDIRIKTDHVEKLLSGFSEEKIVAVTGRVIPVKPKNIISGWLAEGRRWNYTLYAFRKRGQAYRNALYVLSGCNTMYRTDYLKKHPFRLETVTEDLDQTWRIFENGYKVNVVPDAIASSRIPETPRQYWKQINRWQRGAWQGYFVHGKDLFKSKSLLYTTLIPNTYGSMIHSSVLLATPIVAIINPLLGLYLFLGELAISSIITLCISPRSLLPQNYPGVLLHKYISATSWLASATSTMYEAVSGQRDKWKVGWTRVKNDFG